MIYNVMQCEVMAENVLEKPATYGESFQLSSPVTI